MSLISSISSHRKSQLTILEFMHILNNKIKEIPSNITTNMEKDIFILTDRFNLLESNINNNIYNCEEEIHYINNDIHYLKSKLNTIEEDLNKIKINQEEINKYIINIINNLKKDNKINNE